MHFLLQEYIWVFSYHINLYRNSCKCDFLFNKMRFLSFSNTPHPRYLNILLSIFFGTFKYKNMLLLFCFDNYSYYIKY